MSSATQGVLGDQHDHSERWKQHENRSWIDDSYLLLSNPLFSGLRAFFPVTGDIEPGSLDFADGILCNNFFKKEDMTPLETRLYPIVVCSRESRGSGREETACTRCCDIVWRTCKPWGSSRGRRRETVAHACRFCTRTCVYVLTVVISLAQVFTGSI